MTDPQAQKATIYDVADHAGVSISTVSRAFNGYEDVSESTAERVYAAAKALKFRPDRAARALAQRDFEIIGVAVSSFTTAFHTELLKGVRDRLRKREADFLIHDLDWERPSDSLRRFLSKGAIDGLLLVGMGMDLKLRSQVSTLGGPAVVLGSSAQGVDTIEWDHEKGARRATEHLVSQGYSQIRMITTHHEDSTRSARIKGFRAALAEANLGFRAHWIATGQTDKHAGFSEESGYEAMKTLLGQTENVEAVFASSDVQAIGAWQALRQQGYEVPGDVALIGYDDLKVSRYIGLSSISQRIRHIGGEAIELLLKRLSDRGPREAVSRRIEPEVTPRASTGGNVR